MSVLKVTLDTNCIIDNVEKQDSHIERIRELAEQRRIDLAITTRTISDKKQDTFVERKQRHIKEFNKYKTIGTIARVGHSRLNSGDFISSRKDSETISRISEILFGKSRKNNNNKRIRNKICDIDHLVGHLIHKRDIFITSDKDFLKRTKRELLKKEFNLIVESPKEFLKRFKVE